MKVKTKKKKKKLAVCWVKIENGKFSPNKVPAKRGCVVRWDNKDDVGYRLYFRNSPFKESKVEQRISAPAHGSSSDKHKVHAKKPSGGYSYKHTRVVGVGGPPNPPQVVVGG